MSIRKPMLLVFAGPNGSGKSTITKLFEKKDFYKAKVPKNTVKSAFFGNIWCLGGV